MTQPVHFRVPAEIYSRLESLVSRWPGKKGALVCRLVELGLDQVEADPLNLLRGDVAS